MMNGLLTRVRSFPAQGLQRSINNLLDNTVHENQGTTMSNGLVKREGQSLQTRLEELEISLEAAHAVNAHLNSEVERLLTELEQLRQDKTNYEKHIQELSGRLANENRKTASLRASQASQPEALKKFTEAVKEQPDSPAPEVEEAAPVVTEPERLNDLAENNTLDHGAIAFQPPPEPSGDDGEPEDWVTDPRWEQYRKEAAAAGWLISPNEIHLGEKLGQGAFGTTYKGTWRGVIVAVKQVRVSTVTEAETFMREVDVLSSTRHPHLLPFYGACMWPKQYCWTITEYMTGGNLAQWLYGNPSKVGTPFVPRRPLEEKLQMGLEIAQGMQAFEESDPPIVHRDLKPSNIFIDSNGHARIADLGLCRRLTPDCAAYLTGETGTYMYMSPEMVRHELYDIKTDVYSWGVMMVELITQTPPFAGKYLTPVQVALLVSEGKLKPQLPANFNPDAGALINMTFEQEPELRPSFGFITSYLPSVIDTVRQQSSQNQNFMSRMFGRRPNRPAMEEMVDDGVVSGGRV